MLNKKLQTDYWNEMCYQLLKLMRNLKIQKVNIKFRGGLLGLKRLQGFLELLLLRGNNTSRQERVVKCYNCQAQEVGQILDEEQLAFLEDPGVPDGQVVQTTISNNVAFKTEDLDAYDPDCDDISDAKAVLMANISNYGFDVIIEEKAHQEKNNESLTTELERYKKRVKTSEQRLIIDLSSHEKMIDSQMDDMIKEKIALKEQVDSLKQNLSKQIKEKEFLLQTFTIFKNESKEKENKYMENEIDLEKKIKELDNIVYKVGYQNLFYLKKSQRIKPTLYDGSVISDKHVAMPVTDDEETLILEEDFRKRFVPQQELSAEQAFWFHMSNPSTQSFVTSPIKVEAPSELPKEQAGILWGIVKQAKAKQPLDNALDFSCNTSPLTRITTTKVVPIKDSTPHSVGTQKLELKVYSRRPKHVKNVGSSKKDKIVESKNANNLKPNHTWGSNATNIPSSSSLINDRLSRLFSGTYRFENDQIAKIMGYGDYQLSNVIISRVYYVEGLGHTLFSVGQFCDADLEVAFWKNTCFIQNLEGVDLLSGFKDINLYTISLDEMLKTSSIYLLSKVSKTKRWLWHCQLSYLNFVTLNKLAKDGLARGIPKLKF
ncbi:hypothetical protein Tco_1352957 [Tanacetum coccineum]